MEKLTTVEQHSQYVLPQGLPPRERAARQYVIESFRSKMPSLIPFAFENESILKLAAYLLKYTTGSRATLYQYVFGVHRFSNWLGKKPDDIIRETMMEKGLIDTYLQKIDDFIGDLQAEGLAPGTVANHVKGVKALCNANGVNLVLPHRLSRRVKFPDRAPSPEELQRLINLADISEKVMLSLIALGGFREGTLVKLQYRHVKKDLESGTVPLHIHVEAEITKGKYCAYDTFIGAEAVEYLKAYLETRRKGSANRRMPPETIVDNSPLIRDERIGKRIKSITEGNVHRIIHELYFKAGLLEKGTMKRYELRVHSIRKYFRTQLGSIRTMPTDYTEYMMGHTVSTYNDIKMKGVEFLRNLYASSGLSVRPRTKLSKIDRLKMFAESLGLNPDEVLTREALSIPHRTIVDPEHRQVEILNQALKEAIIRELRSR